jgi:hypothetical protein
MRTRFIGAIIAVLLVVSLAVPAFAATPNPGKGPPDLERLVFVHPKMKDVKPFPAKPAKEPVLYSYSRYHWSTLPIKYYYNPDNSPVGNVVSGVTASFQTWQDDPNSSVTFEYQGSTSALSPGLDTLVPDKNNVVGWAPLNDDHAIAVTIIWANTRTRIVVDIDTAFNLDDWLAWGQENISGDPDNVPISPDATFPYDSDVQNIMTHEAGHWLVLDDLYFTAASEQTMYGYAGQRELKKRSLESGDMAGLLKIYP